MGGRSPAGLRLGWERPAPLLVTKILDPSLRSGPAGGRPRPTISLGLRRSRRPMRWPPATRMPWPSNSRDGRKSFSLLRRNCAPSARRVSSSCCSLRIASRRRGPRNVQVFRIALRGDCSTVSSTRRGARSPGATELSALWAVTAMADRSDTRRTSTRRSRTCRRARAGANGNCASRRRSSPKRTRAARGLGAFGRLKLQS